MGGRIGKTPEDAAMLYVVMPLSSNKLNGYTVAYGCSLEEPINDLIDGGTDPTTGKIEDKEMIGICHRVASRLHELADKLNAACREE